MGVYLKERKRVYDVWFIVEICKNKEVYNREKEKNKLEDLYNPDISIVFYKDNKEKQMNYFFTLLLIIEENFICVI